MPVSNTWRYLWPLVYLPIAGPTLFSSALPCLLWTPTTTVNQQQWKKKCLSRNNQKLNHFEVILSHCSGSWGLACLSLVVWIHCKSILKFQHRYLQSPNNGLFHFVQLRVIVLWIVYHRCRMYILKYFSERLALFLQRSPFYHFTVEINYICIFEVLQSFCFNER